MNKPAIIHPPARAVAPSSGDDAFKMGREDGAFGYPYNNPFYKVHGEEEEHAAYDMGYEYGLGESDQRFRMGEEDREPEDDEPEEDDDYMSNWCK